MGWTTEVRFPAREGFFLCSPLSPDRLWGPPTPTLDGYRFTSLGVKRPGRETDQSLPSSAKVKNSCSYTSIPKIHLHGVVLN
jgi:hypothetical protein